MENETDKKVTKRDMVRLAIPLIAWALILFLVLSVPVLMGLENPVTIGLMVWLLLVLSASSWFVSALQRFLDGVSHG